MSGKIEISRELAEEILKILRLDNWQQAEPLAEAIAAPAVERQEPIYQLSVRMEQTKEAWFDVSEEVRDEYVARGEPWVTRTLYTSAPVAVSDEQLQALADEAFRKWEKTGNPVSGVNGYMAAKAGFREGAAWAACAEFSLYKVKDLNQWPTS